MASQIPDVLSVHRLDPGSAGRSDLTPLAGISQNGLVRRDLKDHLVSQVVYHRQGQLPQDLEGILLNVT